MPKRRAGMPDLLGSNQVILLCVPGTVGIAFRPDGAAGCSHGWSDAFRRRGTRGNGSAILASSYCPAGAKEAPGRRDQVRRAVRVRLMSRLRRHIPPPRRGGTVGIRPLPRVALARLRRVALHPWLQPGAPLGRRVEQVCPSYLATNRESQSPDVHRDQGRRTPHPTGGR